MARILQQVAAVFLVLEVHLEGDAQWSC